MKKVNYFQGKVKHEQNASLYCLLMIEKFIMNLTSQR